MIYNLIGLVLLNAYNAVRLAASNGRDMTTTPIYKLETYHVVYRLCKLHICPYRDTLRRNDCYAYALNLNGQHLIL